jgi:hypothetical protein
MALLAILLTIVRDGMKKHAPECDKPVMPLNLADD